MGWSGSDGGMDERAGQEVAMTGPARTFPVVRKIYTLAGVGPYRLMLVAEACASLFTARVMLAIYPFKTVSKAFGTLVQPTDDRLTECRADASSDHVMAAKQIGWAVRASAPFMPFKSVCLQQAMAAHAMLKRRGVHSTMHLGAGRGSDTPLEAHAWLDAAGVKVTGYPVAPNLVEIGCFV